MSISTYINCTISHDFCKYRHLSRKQNQITCKMPLNTLIFHLLFMHKVFRLTFSVTLLVSHFPLTRSTFWHAPKLIIIHFLFTKPFTTSPQEHILTIISNIFHSCCVTNVPNFVDRYMSSTAHARIYDLKSYIFKTDNNYSF